MNLDKLNPFYLIKDLQKQLDVLETKNKELQLENDKLVQEIETTNSRKSEG